MGASQNPRKPKNAKWRLKFSTTFRQSKISADRFPKLFSLYPKRFSALNFQIINERWRDLLTLFCFVTPTLTSPWPSLDLPSFTSNCNTHSQLKLKGLGMGRARKRQLQSSLRHLQLMQMQSNSYYLILRVALLCELHNRQRKRTKLSRSAIQSPKLAPWEHLLNFGDDNSFLNMTGLSRNAFMEMEKIMFPTPEEQRPNGRPLSLNRRGQLGLLLFYTTESDRGEPQELSDQLPSADRLLHFIAADVVPLLPSRAYFA